MQMSIRGKDWGKSVGEDRRKLFANEEVQGVSAAGGEHGGSHRDTVCAAVSSLCFQRALAHPGIPNEWKTS